MTALIYTCWSIQFIEIAELKYSFLPVFDLLVEIETDLIAGIEHLIFMGHEHKTQVIITFVEGNQLIKILITECMPEQSDRIVAPGSPGMCLSPVSCLRVDQLFVIMVHDNVHSTSAYSTREHCIWQVHEHIISDDGFERNTFRITYMLIQKCFNAFQGLFQSIRTRRLKASWNSCSHGPDLTVIKLDLVPEIFVVQWRVMTIRADQHFSGFRPAFNGIRDGKWFDLMASLVDQWQLVDKFPFEWYA